MKSLDLRMALVSAENLADDDAMEIQILTEDGDVFDIVSVEYDPEAEVTYLKCELAE